MHQFSLYVRDIGFQITFVLPSKPRDRYGELASKHIEYLESIGKVDFILMRRWYKYIAGDYKSAKIYFGNIKTDSIVFSFGGYAGKITRLLFKQKVIKNLYHVPECIDFIRRPFPQRLIEYLFEKMLSKYAKFYIASGPSEAYNMAKNFNIREQKIILLPNHVNIHPNYVNERQRCNDQREFEYEFLILGRVSQDKRVLEVLQSLSSLALTSKTAVVGDGEMLDKLTHMFPEATFYGNVPQLEVYRIIQKSKFVVSGSIIEGLPFSIIEAMSIGIVPILSDVPGHTDLVIDGLNGFLFKDFRELSCKIFHTQQIEPDLYNEMSKRSQHKAFFLRNIFLENFNKHFSSGISPENFEN